MMFLIQYMHINIKEPRHGDCKSGKAGTRLSNRQISALVLAQTSREQSIRQSSALVQTTPWYPQCLNV
jgi:hypothetical protein